MKALPRKAESAHQAVHNERRASHVARVLKQREEEEEEEDDRNEGRDRLEAAADAVGQEDRGAIQGCRDVRQEVRETRRPSRRRPNVEEVNERAAQVLREQKSYHDERKIGRPSQRLRTTRSILSMKRRGSFADADNRLLGDVGHRLKRALAIAISGRRRIPFEVGNDLFDVGGIDVRKLFFKTRSAFHELAGEPGARSKPPSLRSSETASDRLDDLSSNSTAIGGMVGCSKLTRVSLTSLRPVSRLATMPTTRQPSAS